MTPERVTRSGWKFNVSRPARRNRSAHESMSDGPTTASHRCRERRRSEAARCRITPIASAALTPHTSARHAQPTRGVRSQRRQAARGRSPCGFATVPLWDPSGIDAAAVLLSLITVTSTPRSWASGRTRARRANGSPAGFAMTTTLGSPRRRRPCRIRRPRRQGAPRVRA